METERLFGPQIVVFVIQTRRQSPWLSLTAEEANHMSPGPGRGTKTISYIDLEPLMVSTRTAKRQRPTPIP
jgi:hypothetical protein